MEPSLCGEGSVGGYGGMAAHHLSAGDHHMEEFSDYGRGSRREATAAFLATFALGLAFWYFVGSSIIWALS